MQRTTIEKELQNTGNGYLPSKLPFFSLRLTKSEFGNAFIMIKIYLVVGRKNDDIATFYTANVKFVPSRHGSSGFWFPIYRVIFH